MVGSDLIFFIECKVTDSKWGALGQKVEKPQALSG
jgi:hypothetical protein